GPRFEVKIVEIDRSMLVSACTEGNHTTVASSGECAGEAGSEQEVSKVIDGKVHFKTLLRARERVSHDAGVIDENIQAPVVAEKVVRESPHAVKVRQIHLVDADLAVAGIGDQPV